MSLLSDPYKTGGFVIPGSDDRVNMLKYFDKSMGANNDAKVGRFAIKLAENPDVNVTYRKMPDGDYFVVYPRNNPDKAALIKTTDNYVPEWEQKINKEIAEYLEKHPKFKTKDGTGKSLKLSMLILKKKFLTILKNNKGLADLPDAMRMTIEIAKKMQKRISL